MVFIDPVLSDILKEGKPIREVLDIGTAQGHIFLEIAKTIKKSYPDTHFIGIDRKYGLSEKVLAAGIIDPREGNYFRAGIPDGSIDLLTLVYIAQAMDDIGQHYLFDWASRKLSDEGEIIFVDVIKRGRPYILIDQIKHHLFNGLARYNIKSKRGWTGKFGPWNGLEVVNIHDLPDRSVVIRARKMKKED